MTVVVAAVAGVLAGALAWRALGPVLAHDALRRTNVRGRELPTAGGVAVVVAVLALATGGVLWQGERHGDGAAWTAVAFVVLGFALLGLVDDLLGERSGAGGDRGFRGHVRALAAGRLTTGGCKLVGGAMLATIGVVAAGSRPGVRAVGEAAVVALAANLGNLLDRAPGRVAKAALLAFGTVVAAALISGVPADRVAPYAGVAGVTAAVLVPDVRERMMLGDTGANALGAVAGLAVVTMAGGAVVAATGVVLGALNVLSEVVSFSRIIERVPPLRALDRLGRTP